MRRDLAVLLFLVAAILALYGQTARHEFVYYDDDRYVYENPDVRSGLTAQSTVWAFTTMWAGNWHPLTWLSHMLDCELFGLRAGHHHLVNVFFHILNALLLYLVLKGMTGAVWRSAMVAALFALHPLHAESVAWVSERKDVLSTLFFLLTLWAYGRYAGCPSLARYVPVFVFLALGLAAKPMLVTVPFVLLLLDYWPLGRLRFPGATALRRLAEKVPLFLLAGLSCLATFVAQQAAGAMTWMQVPFPVRAANALVSYAAYIGKTLWPSGLAVFYPYPGAIPATQWAGAALVLAATSGLVALGRRRRPYLAVGWLWYLGTLVPVIGLIQVGKQSMADRYTYIPLIGLFLLAVWLAADLAAGRRHGRVALAGLSSVALLACMTATRAQVAHWRSSETLFEHALRVTRGNAIAHTNLGVVLLSAGRTDEAIRHFREALRIDPRDAQTQGNLGIALMRQGKTEDALRHCREALRLNPRSALSHLNLGAVLAQAGRGEEAVTHFRLAVHLAPRSTEARYNLGLALLEAGNIDEALVRLGEALELNPHSGQMHHTLGLILSRQGRNEEALEHYRQAARIDPKLAELYAGHGTQAPDPARAEEETAASRGPSGRDPGAAGDHLDQGLSLARQGRLDEALAEFRRALELDGESGDIRTAIAVSLESRGDLEGAVRHYREAIRLRPQDPRAYNNLAWILATHPDPAFRNGAEAVELAEKACDLTGESDVNLLDTLAAAYAEAGRFEEAIATLELAVSLAPSGGLAERIPELTNRLQAYREGRPHREARAAPRQGRP
jgi:Flp pilus assembly protein TadD